MRDLIIGYASNYSWNELKYWVNSINRSGFSGDVLITGTNLTKEVLDILSDNKVHVLAYGEKQKNGDFLNKNNGMAPHVERFLYIWNYLIQTKQEYRYVITTDTRDVIFQKNPSDWLEKNLTLHQMVASSEGMKYKNEPWGNKNLYDALGPYFHSLLREHLIYNVGTIAGEYETVKGLLLLLYQLSLNRPIPIVDQAIYNLLVHTTPFLQKTYFSNNKDSWAIQLGTTFEAVKSGSGDLGLNFGMDPTKQTLYKLNYEDEQPVIDSDGIVRNPINSESYVIVHQYDRIPELKTKIYEIYGD